MFSASLRPVTIGKSLVALLLAASSGAVLAQSGPADPMPPEKVTQVFVYGDDPCPPSTGDDILVCARLPDRDRYRIPTELRGDPNSPQVQSWANRARSIEYVGRTGTDSCTPVGGGGFTGCFEQISRNAREERKAMLGSASWADAVANEREKRLGNLDAESEVIEARAKAEEAAAAKAAAEAEKAADEAEKAADEAVSQAASPK